MVRSSLANVADFSDDLGETGSGHWTVWMGAKFLIVDSWDCPVAGTAVPVVRRWVFSRRIRACSESTC